MAVSFPRFLRVPLLLVLLAVGLWALPRIASFGQSPERAFLVDPVHCTATSSPEWLTGPIDASLRSTLAALAPAPLRSDEEVTALARALGESNGWVRSIDRIEKRYPNRLEIEFTLREPIALVESDQGLLLVDDDGVLVAPAADAGPYLARHELPLLHARAPLRRAVLGAKLADPWLEEGLRVAQELAPHAETLAARSLTIAVIDVSVQPNAGGRALTDVQLYTRDGLAIEWGRSAGSPRFGVLEPGVDAKIRGLLRVASKHPELAGIQRVRLQFNDPYVVLDTENATAP